jgi:hypothetical protein
VEYFYVTSLGSCLSFLTAIVPAIRGKRRYSLLRNSISDQRIGLWLGDVMLHNVILQRKRQGVYNVQREGGGGSE